MTISENVTMSKLGSFGRFGIVLPGLQNKNTGRWIEKLQIKCQSPLQKAQELSGGNQQKLVLAKSLAADCKILIVDEPTRGIDVGAKTEIHSLIDELAGSGKAVLLISSELPELINLSTNIIVFRQGRITGSLSREKASQEKVLRLMAGINN